MARKAPKKWFDELSDVAKNISVLISAATVIVGTVIGACNWLSSYFKDTIAAEVEGFREEARATDIEQSRSITRMELMYLFENDPENIAAIEKTALHYFSELDGDQYMTSLYSKWCLQYGGNVEIIMSGRKND